MLPANINLPRILRVGAGASREVVSTLLSLGLENPLVVTDPFMVECGYASQITSDLEASGKSFGVFDECIPDPTTDSVCSALDKLKKGSHDSLIGLGGGSSLDTAKAVAVLAVRDGIMRDYKVPYVINSGLPIIAIPTTAGTGSEATRVAVITDTDTQEKMLCMGLGLMPVAALVDFELTITMPYRLTADTGIDSLCHALEAFVSEKANAFTDSIALNAMSTISRNIRTACEHPNDLPSREAMMLAATQGGIAFSNSSVTLIHGMSRPIGAFFHVPHGLSNAMLLPSVTAWSVAGRAERYAEASRIMGLAKQSDSDEKAITKLIDGLYSLNNDLSVPSPSAFGIKKTDWFDNIETMAEQALSSGSPANNPRVPEKDQIMGLYEKVWAEG